MGRVLGIDLGTTNSAMAYVEDGKPIVIHNPKSVSKNTTPSLVGLISEDHDGFLVGDLAREVMEKGEKRIIYEVKRKMGSQEKIKLGSNNYAPEEISAVILKELKYIAEQEFNEIVEEAVITVPARFDDNQRRATKAAGKIAGLKVLRVINEPTAAAIAYGMRNMRLDEKLLVYDLGGGTFDVSVLEMCEGMIDVLTSDGDMRLGGHDFDDIIIDMFIEKLKENNPRVQLDDYRVKERMKVAAERCKINLTMLSEVEVIVSDLGVDSRGMPLELHMVVTRDEFEIKSQKFLKKTEKVIDDVLRSQKLRDTDIDAVLLIGGSTKMPFIYNWLNKRFRGKVKKNINPDTAVAMGAALQGEIIKNKIINGEEPIITDVCPYSIGTSVTDHMGEDKYDPILKKDRIISTVKKKRYATVQDDQRGMLIDIYQGESENLDKNTKIGEFKLEGIPAGRAGEQSVEVSIAYDENGIIKVDAVILSTGKRASTTINLTGMDEEQIKKARATIEECWGKSSGGF